MVALTGTAPEAIFEHIPIETLRAIAVLLLVSYHVIGPAPDAGLSIEYPHVLRLYADFFVDFRMPFFAFIAGYVYALRPVTLLHYPTFIAGKFRRLYLPGCIAMLVFAISANLIGNRFSMAWAEVGYVFLQSYVHFWFLQSILLIFLCFGLVDSLVKQRFSGVFLVLSCVLYLSDFRFSTSFFSANGALYLFPFFMVGVVFNRYAAEIWQEAEKVTVLLVVVAVGCALWNIKILYETDAFSLVRRDVQSIGLGVSACVLAMLWCPRLPMLEKLSPYAFTIYLYHVFGTSGARMVNDRLGITQIELRFLIGVAAGILLPITICMITSRLEAARRLGLVG